MLFRRFVPCFVLYGLKRTLKKRVLFETGGTEHGKFEKKRYDVLSAILCGEPTTPGQSENGVLS
jgi:hypothetical protein